VTLFEKLNTEARMAFAQATAQSAGAPERLLSLLAAALVSTPSVATAVLDVDALLHDLGAPSGEIDFGTMPGFTTSRLSGPTLAAYNSLEHDVATAAEESVPPARVLLALAEADANLRAILARNDLPEDVLRELAGM